MKGKTVLNPVDAAFLNRLSAALPEGVIGPAEPRFLQEPRGVWHGQAGAVARPRDVAQVSTILAAAHQARVGVVPFGGGTGLVGGQVLPKGPRPLILSLDRMAKVRGGYPVENALVAEAGMTVAAVQEAATGMGRLFALSLASEGSAQLGGVLATNAGGLNVLRYGNARDLVLGVEAVLADGTVIHGLKRLRKDNTGYDLRHLLIGSEGTLGIITAASLRLFTPPADVATALLSVASPQAALDLLQMAQARLPGMVQAFELIHAQGPHFLAETGMAGRAALNPIPEWSVLIELGLPSDFGPARDHLEALFAAGLQAGLCGDGILAQSEAERAAMWRMREDIPHANRRIGAIASHDISLPLSEIPGFLDRMPRLLAGFGPLRINAFGHLGDGNLHYNVFPAPGLGKADYADRRAALSQLVHDQVDALGGSVSAEHGLGRLKVGELLRYGDPGKITAMRAIKAALDPHGILNPGAVLA